MNAYQQVVRMLAELGTALTGPDWELLARISEEASGVGYATLKTLRARATQQLGHRTGLVEAARALAVVSAATGNGPAQPPAATVARWSRQRTALTAVETPAVALQSRALQARLHSVFNQSYLADTGSTEPLVRRAVLRARLDGEQREWLALLRGVFAKCALEAPPADIAAAAAAAAAAIELLVPRLARDAALTARDAERLLAAGRGTEAEATGRLAVALAATLREAVTVHAAFLALSLDVLVPSGRNAGSSLVEAVPEMAFDVELPNGTDVELHRLQEVEDGKLVEFRAFVTEVRAFRDADGKLVSRATLRDPSSTAEATIVGVFAHWAHAGMTRGAAVRVTGTWRVASGLNAGDPALEVTQLPLAAIAERAWRPALLRLGATWFPRWRNELQIDWSLAPHLPPDDPAPARQGAVELVYLPIL